MKRFKIGDKVLVLDNLNMTALGKVGTIISNRDRGHVVGFFYGDVMTNYELDYFKRKYPGLKATWWYNPCSLELANSYTNTKFK
mgnify:CR=1 FL=1|jgi:hypothetical protein